MVAFGRILIAMLVVVVAVRAAAAATFAAWEFPKRRAVYFTEPQMVHLAQRVQLGERIYPEWRDFPHVVNVFTPGYFIVVGLLGRAAAADVDALQWIGRGVTLLFAIVGAFAVGWSVRKLGSAAAIAAACSTLGAGVMMGFGWMARPDVSADVLGFLGFLCAASPALIALAIGLSAAAVLCKQTAVVYVLAASVALAWQGDRRRAAIVLIGTTALTVAVLGMAFLSGERRIFADVLLESSSPWRWDHWLEITRRLGRRSNDLLLLGAIGAAMWIVQVRSGDADRRRESKRWLSLLGVAGGFGLLGSAKFGSDVNYYLPLRYVAAAALAEVVARLWRPEGIRILAAVFAATASLVFCLLPWLPLLANHPKHNPITGEKNRIADLDLAIVVRLSRSQRVLTNSEDAALRIDNPFVDAFLFKLLADTGRLDPQELRRRLEGREYDWVATTAALDDPAYAASAMSLPAELTSAILENYDKVAQRALVFYRAKERK